MATFFAAAVSSRLRYGVVKKKASEYWTLDVLAVLRWIKSAKEGRAP